MVDEFMACVVAAVPDGEFGTEAMLMVPMLNNYRETLRAARA